MLTATIDSVGLEVIVARPLTGRTGIITAHATGESTLDGTLRLTRTNATDWALAADWKQDTARVPASVTTSVPFRVGPLDLTVVAADTVHSIELRLIPRYKVRERLDDRLVVRRRSREPSSSSALRRPRSPAHRRWLASSSDLLNYARLLESGDAGKTIGELRHATDSVAGALRAADVRLRDYQAEAKLIAPVEQATAQVKRIAALRTQLDQVELERDALARLLTLVDERSRGGRDAVAYRQLATFPTLIGNRGIQDLLAALIELENDRAKLGARRTDENVDVRAITDRIEALERDLRRVGSQYQESLNQQFTESTRALARLTERPANSPPPKCAMCGWPASARCSAKHGSSCRSNSSRPNFRTPCASSACGWSIPPVFHRPGTRSFRAPWCTPCWAPCSPCWWPSPPALSACSGAGRA